MRRINEIALERRGISADTALRLARYFKTTPQFWLNLQSHYELDTARMADEKVIIKTIQPGAGLGGVAIGVVHEISTPRRWSSPG